MALRVQKIIPGRIKGGRFYPNPAKAGTGKRMQQCIEEVTTRGGAQSPRAVCASAGIRKYGKKRMMKWAKKGKARAARKNTKKKKPSVKLKYSKSKKRWYQEFQGPGPLGTGGAMRGYLPKGWKPKRRKR